MPLIADRADREPRRRRGLWALWLLLVPLCLAVGLMVRSYSRPVGMDIGRYFVVTGRSKAAYRAMGERWTAWQFHRQDDAMNLRVIRTVQYRHLDLPGVGLSLIWTWIE